MRLRIGIRLCGRRGEREGEVWTHQPSFQKVTRDYYALTDVRWGFEGELASIVVRMQY